MQQDTEILKYMDRAELKEQEKEIAFWKKWRDLAWCPGPVGFERKLKSTQNEVTK